MGIANAQRTLNYIRILTEFICQPEIAAVVPLFGILVSSIIILIIIIIIIIIIIMDLAKYHGDSQNEAFVPAIALPAIRAFYLEVYTLVREISGTGKGPMISIHDAFLNPTAWNGFLSGSDRIALDSHDYLCFSGANNDSMTVQVGKPCTWV